MKNTEKTRNAILNRQTALGIEFGSTRIKATLIDSDFEPIASGGFAWENEYADGIWTYSLDDAWKGLRGTFAALKKDVAEKYGVGLTNVGTVGISGMMHGYLPFDGDGVPLVPFRTWRNAITARAARELSELFDFNVPQRWSVAHLYQAILNREEHIDKIASLATLASYVHWRLTGERVIGACEASGMFPIDPETRDYDARMTALFNEKASERGFKQKIEDLLPKTLPAGENAGKLTPEGALLLDPTGEFRPGAPMCPPEGDAGTGMTATNSVAPRTGNVSAGTSIFLTVVLEKALSKRYPEVDILATPWGKPAAMIHCGNGTGEIDAWADVLASFCRSSGFEISRYEILDKIFESALKGDKDCGGLVAFNYLSGEVITGFERGGPMFFRGPKSKFTFENFARAQLCSAVATLSLGMRIFADENVAIDGILGHGGFFKAPEAGPRITSAALGAPVSVMKTAGEGGPWGMAVLAEYAVSKEKGETPEDYLNKKVFAGFESVKTVPDPEDVAGFKKFLENYKKGLAAERAAAEAF